MEQTQPSMSAVPHFFGSHMLRFSKWNSSRGWLRLTVRFRHSFESCKSPSLVGLWTVEFHRHPYCRKAFHAKVGENSPNITSFRPFFSRISRHFAVLICWPSHSHRAAGYLRSEADIQLYKSRNPMYKSSRDGLQPILEYAIRQELFGWVH